MARLVRRHEGVVFRFLLGLTKDEDEARDLAQETFLKALRNLGGFRGEGSLRGWLLAIARNEARTAHRRRLGRRETGLLDDSEDAVSPEEPTEVRLVREDEAGRVRRAVDRLPEKQRLAVTLRIFDELNFREIAEITDSTEGAARVNYHYGIRRLREWLGGPPELEEGEATERSVDA